MPFPPGTDVVVIAINRRGRVLDSRGAMYRVLVGGLTMTCRENQIRAVEGTKAAARRQKRPAAHEPTVPARSRASHDPHTVRSIDLHGMTVEQARAAVVDFLSRAVMEGADTLEIVHGIGTGRVRDAIRRELQAIAAVRHVRPHPTNPGVTIVHL